LCLRAFVAEYFLFSTIIHKAATTNKQMKFVFNPEGMI
jgi:hypothetical protein